jgi:hypothetical protein
LAKNQFEVLEIVARSLDQTISEYITDITETILSMMECELEDTISSVLKKKPGRPTGSNKRESVNRIMGQKENKNKKKGLYLPDF